MSDSSTQTTPRRRPVRHNLISRQELRQRIQSDETPRTALSFYRYARIEHPAEFRNQFYDTLQEIGTLGRIYVAREGINAQISVPDANLELLRPALERWPFLHHLRLNFAIENDPHAFYVLKIKVRDKIVADGLDDSTFDASQSGQHLSAAQFNALTEQADTVVVDMRNHYECEVGHFQNALCFNTDTFRQTLQDAEKALEEDKDKAIVMYCTGGIRCEKASAWMKHRGYRNVYQLEGGIIEYARQVKQQGLENRYIGINFVFDERLSERIGPEVIAHCHLCGKAWDHHTNCLNTVCHVLFLQCPECAEQYAGCCSEACQEFHALPSEQQAHLRKGFEKAANFYGKGRLGQNTSKVQQLLNKAQEEKEPEKETTAL